MLIKEHDLTVDNLDNLNKQITDRKIVIMAKDNKKIDLKQLEALCNIGCTMSEVAAVFNCSESTLSRRFSKYFKNGIENAKISLRRKQYALALEGNVPLLIHLSKHVLNQNDKVTLAGDKEAPLEILVRYVDEPDSEDQ